MNAPSLTIRPVTGDNWPDFEALFEARGGPHYCWCTSYRFPRREHFSDEEKKAGIQGFVTDSVPIGVLAYDGEKPIGWCSIAPRETYHRLDRSRKLPRVTPMETSTWTVLCFFVPHSQRGKGLSHFLLHGAIEYAREMGAEIIEAYPFDSAEIKATHRGHSSVFRKAGFVQDGARWFLLL